MNTNVRPSSEQVLEGSIPADTLVWDADAADSSEWIDASKAAWIRADIVCGNGEAGAIVTLTWEQSKKSDGSNPAVLEAGGFASTAFTADNIKGTVEEHTDLIDEDYRYVRVTATATVGDMPCAVAVYLCGPKNETGLAPTTIP